jgi:hypothetical protein
VRASDHRNAEKEQDALVQQEAENQRPCAIGTRGLHGVLQLLCEAWRSQADVGEVGDDCD